MKNSQDSWLSYVYCLKMSVSWNVNKCLNIIQDFKRQGGQLQHLILGFRSYKWCFVHWQNRKLIVLSQCTLPDFINLIHKNNCFQRVQIGVLGERDVLLNCSIKHMVIVNSTRSVHWEFLILFWEPFYNFNIFKEKSVQNGWSTIIFSLVTGNY